MTTYKIYHKGILYADLNRFLSPLHPKCEEIWIRRDGFLTITCPVEEVRVEKNGNPVELHLVDMYGPLDSTKRYSVYSIEEATR